MRIKPLSPNTYFIVNFPNFYLQVTFTIPISQPMPNGVLNIRLYQHGGAAENKTVSIEKLKEKEVPQEMKPMNITQRKEYVDTKSKERAKIKGQMAALEQKRNAYLAQEKTRVATSSAAPAATPLEDVMLKSVKKRVLQKILNSRTSLLLSTFPAPEKFKKFSFTIYDTKPFSKNLRTRIKSPKSFN